MTFFFGTTSFKTYSFTAFSASQLLSQGTLGSSVGCGDTFKMPTYADSRLSVRDDDRFLSGDSCWNERADDRSGQEAQIQKNGCSAGNGGKIYAESYFWVKDQSGKWYLLIEIEQEGTSDKYFTFHSGYGMPPAGATLTIHSQCDVTSNWIDYSCLGSGPQMQLGSVGGRFFVDADGDNTEVNTAANGTKTWEAGVAGAKVELLDASGKVVATTTTDSYGTYKFDCVVPGNYKIKFYNTDGSEFIKKNVGPSGEDSDANGNGVTDLFAIGNGQHLWNIDAGIRYLPDGGATCIVIQAEKMSLKGYAVEKRGDASDGAGIVLCASSGSAATKFTGESGKYDFSMTYMDESDGRGKIGIYVNGKLVQWVWLNKDNNGDGAIGKSSWSTLTIKDLQLDKGDVITLVGYANCYEYARIDKITLCKVEEPKLGSIGDRVWLDLDRNGIQDDGESGLEGVTVKLLSAAGAVIATTTTDANGNYLFTGLAAGQYKVQFDLPAGHAFSPANVGNDALDSDADPASGTTGIITLAAGDENLTVDAGVYQLLARLGDRVWFDANRNGIQDDGETGVAGVTVNLIGAGADGIFGTEDDIIRTETTDENGDYLFDELAAGDYMVEFVLADGFDFTTPDAGDDTLDSDADPVTGKTGIITLAAGDENLTVDAGLVRKNGVPTANDDSGKGCANAPITVDVLANDSDPDGDALTITHVDGKAISAGGSVTTAAGTVVSLVGGKLVFDGTAAYAGLNLGQKGYETVGYTVSDGNGGTASANVALAFCGTVDSVQEFCASLMKTVSYQVDESFFGADVSKWDDSGYDVKIVTASGGAAAPLYQGLEFTKAYCLDLGIAVNAGSDFATAPVLTGSVICSADPAAAAKFANLDLINWILNQDYESNGAGSVDGKFSGFEVQAAIWSLTDSYDFAADLGKWPVLGQAQDVQKILDDAWANGQGYDVTTGKIVGVIITPDPVTALNGQPFIIGVEWADFDCLC